MSLSSGNPQILTAKRDSNDALTRRILRDSWNGKGALGLDNGFKRIVTPFRAVMNRGDFLARTNYQCGGPNPLHHARPGTGRLGGMVFSHCDGTGVAAGANNPKFVVDSSDYTRYRREARINTGYSDVPAAQKYFKNEAYIPLKRVRI